MYKLSAFGELVARVILTISCIATWGGGGGGGGGISPFCHAGILKNHFVANVIS